jgi:HD superfamily phosphohydrolase YqeK
MIETHDAIERVLGEHAAALGAARTPYRNHVYRVLNYAVALAPALDVERAAMALAYHDIGIWTHPAQRSTRRSGPLR